jgi:hypothetical protein
MAVQLSVAVRNARLDAIESAIGASAVIKIRTGAPPASCATADSGSVLATIALGADWMAAASAGAKALSGLPVTDASADGSGTAGHFRIYASDGTTCHLQGTVGTSGTDMIVDNTSFAAGQQFQITSFTLTDANA